jgi:nucleoside diphosphate kinase
MIKEWMRDPAVFFDGKKQSLFDLLEDLDSDACVEKARDIRVLQTNSAIVFVKPHAVNEAVQELVQKKLEDCGISIVRSGRIDAETIDEKGLIDTHYGAIAARAMRVLPADLVVQAGAKEDFEKLFGLSWDSALERGLVYNARDAAEKLGKTPLQLSEAFDKTNRGVDQLKFGGGFYVAHVDGLYVVNGFYMGMRSKFTAPGGCIQFYQVEWDASALPWEKFRGEVIGSTNPRGAAEGSIRNTIYKQWKSLGLAAEPDTGDNAVHASASPFEGLSERANWLATDVSGDPFGEALARAGVPVGTIGEWMQDPAVLFGGKRQSLFDLLEDLDSGPCLQKATAIVGQQEAPKESRHAAPAGGA